MSVEVGVEVETLVSARLVWVREDTSRSSADVHWTRSFSKFRYDDEVSQNLTFYIY